MKPILAAIVAVCLVFFLFGTATDLISGNKAYYHRQMIENKIPGETGKSLHELDKISDGLRDYLKRGDNRVLKPYFNQNELTHMADVYALFHLMRKLSVAAAVLALAGFCGLAKGFGVREGLRSVGRATLVLIATFLVLTAMVAVNFTKAWYTFHTLFFSNRLWQMDPATDLMIQMLPEPFFFGMVKRIGLIVAAGLIVMGSFALLKGSKHEIK